MFFSMTRSLLHLLLFAGFANAPCSSGVSPSNCPAGYRCRPSRSDDDHNTLSFICCEASDMTVSDYFLETEISPRAVPQIPLTVLNKVVLLDRSSNQRVMVENFDGDVSGADRIVNDTASYDRLDYVQFERQIDTSSGRFLHYILSRNSLSRPTQIQVYYDHPNFGTDFSNLTDMDLRLRRGFAELITNETTHRKEFYRHLIIVLVFRTTEPLGTSRDDENRLSRVLETTNGDLGKLLSHESIGHRLGSPINNDSWNAVCDIEGRAKQQYLRHQKCKLFNDNSNSCTCIS